MQVAIGNWDWEGIAAFLTVSSMLIAAFAWLIRVMMTRNFASHADHAKIEGRISQLEERVSKTATRVDLEKLDARLAPVETGVAVLNSEIKAVREGIQRTEHMVGLLLEHQLRGEGAPT